MVLLWRLRIRSQVETAATSGSWVRAVGMCNAGDDVPDIPIVGPDHFADLLRTMQVARDRPGAIFPGILFNG